jgi:outer membrane protease
MTNKLFSFVGLFLIFLSNSISYAGVKTNINISSMESTNTYQITFPVAENVEMSSKLEFESNFYLVGPEISLPLGDRFRIDASYNTSFQDQDGMLKDTDTASGYSTPLIYSETDLTSDVTDFNIQFAGCFYGEEVTESPILVEGVVGYGLQEFTYRGHDTIQQSIFGDIMQVSGDTIDYQITHNMFYGGIHCILQNTERGLQAKVGVEYAPWVKSEDRDEHLLRGKISDSSGTGDGTRALAEAGWKINESWEIALFYHWLNINVSGDQTQHSSSGMVVSNIPWEAESQQNYFGTRLSYLF